MRNIKVIKVLSYDPTLNGKYSRYKGYRLSALGMTDPPIDYGATTERLESGIVICSTKKRSVDTARLLSDDHRILKSELLNEVTFDLKSYGSEEQFNRLGSSIVRSGFLDAFETDNLIESRDALFTRINGLIELIKIVDDNVVVLVSHSFFMSILQCYIETNGGIERDPKLLRTYIQPDQKRYNFGEGFEFKI